MRSPWVAAPAALFYTALVVPRLPAVLAAVANPELGDVSAPLGSPAGATIGWVHFLAFDLFVARRAYLDSRERGLSPFFMAPVLFATLILGPVRYPDFRASRLPQLSRPETDARFLRRGKRGSSVNIPSDLTWRAGVTYYLRASRLQKILFVSGTLLFLSMVLHLVALIVAGGPLSGPVSFRKPATFSETGWLLCWSVGWLLPLLNFRAWERVVVTTGALVFGLGESMVAIVQAWRGEAFHYNTTTAFNTGIFVLSGVEAAVFFASLVVLVLASLRPQRLAPSLLLSIRTGAVVVVVGTLAGWLMIFNWSGVWQGSPNLLEPGFDTDAANYSRGVTGGNLVVLHAVGVHGLSLVPLAAWLLTFSTLSERARTRLTAGVAGTIFALLMMLAVQALRTLPLSVLDLPTAVLLGASTLALVALYLHVGWAALRGLASSVTLYRR